MLLLRTLQLELMTAATVTRVLAQPIDYLRTRSLSRLLAYMAGYLVAIWEISQTRDCVQVGESYHRWFLRTRFDAIYPELTDTATSSNIDAPNEYFATLRYMGMSDRAIFSLSSESDYDAFALFSESWMRWNAESGAGPIVSVSLSSKPQVGVFGLIAPLKDIRVYPLDTVSSIRCYVEGYAYAYHEADRPLSNPICDGHFAAWLRRVVVPDGIRGAFDWDRIINYSCSSPQQAAHRLFYFVEQYCSRHGG